MYLWGMRKNGFLRRRALWGWLLLLFFSPRQGEAVVEAPFSADTLRGCDIRLHIEGVSWDTLWFGRSHFRDAERTLMAVREADGWWHIYTEEPLPAGMYAFTLRRMVGSPEEQMLCWLLDGERAFRIESSYTAFYHRAKVEGSRENALLYNYLHQHELMQRRLWNTGETWRTLPAAHTLRAHVLSEEAMDRYQRDFMERHKGSNTVGLVERLHKTMPSASAVKAKEWKEESRLRLEWHRAHYFDHFEPAAADIASHPLLLDKLDQYLLLLPPADPDVVLPMADELLERLASNQTLYAYYLPYLIDYTEKIHRHRTEELYVHLVRAYAEKGKLPAVPAQRLQVWQMNADRLERLFEGKKAPQLPLFSRPGTAFNMHEIVADWLLIVFWLPDCAHCRREMPKLIEFYEKYQERGLQVLSICGRTGRKGDDCWQFVEEYRMPADWIVAWDPQRQSRYPASYNVRSYPHLILLDRDKKIRYKLSGAPPANTMPMVLERFLE
jgi:thiol-disulfide isomerase/thioredoxin